ncbi:MAG: MarR family transcriptional regulator [Lachnospiraceae bacterium]|nr:MarR family transcriptional regulator [Lachnospiraceae bacterium]
MDKYPQLKLENQLCFPLYAAAKEIVRRYTPYLEPLDITYTQYLVMMVLWDVESISVKDLGKKLFLDSGTLTPVVKKLETKGYLNRNRCVEDERCVIVSLTDEGMELAKQASAIPTQMGSCVALSKDDAQDLYRILYKLLGMFSEEE